MSGPDFDDFAKLWQQEPDAAEQELMQTLARKARRRARLIGYGDMAWTALIAAIVVATIVAKPDLFTVAAGLLTLAVISWLNWKRRSLRLQLTEAGDPAAFVESSIRAARHNLRRVMLSLAAFPPAILIAILFRISKDTGGRFDHLMEAIAAWALSLRGMIVIPALAGGIVWLVQSGLKFRREIKRLEEVRSAYVEEARLDAAEKG
ncbi:MAG TPA: hypothetical protein VNT77_06405 [Allosphingosinicella sp.]|nr:hypothetical protein [Allosphingosinicella sp.]